MPRRAMGRLSPTVEALLSTQGAALALLLLTLALGAG